MSQSESTTQDNRPEALIDLLTRQHGAACELRELAERQAELIEAGRTDELLTLLGRRQELIDQFTADQQAIGRHTDALDGRSDNLDAATRGRIRELLDGISDALESIMQADARDQQSMKTSQDETQQELTKLGSARQARNAYVGSMAPSGNRFPDRQG